MKALIVSGQVQDCNIVVLQTNNTPGSQFCTSDRQETSTFQVSG